MEGEVPKSYTENPKDSNHSVKLARYKNQLLKMTNINNQLSEKISANNLLVRATKKSAT